VEVLLVAKCVLCESETQLFTNGQPICLKCIKKREREPEKKRPAKFIHVPFTLGKTG
jgi:hypothetical protein